MRLSRTRQLLLTPLLASLGIATPSVAHPASIASMRWHQRILLLATPNTQDPRAVAQRRILSEWQREAADRDVILVEVSGGSVSGASDKAASLVKRYQLPPQTFQALLIGKDGHVAMRSETPIDAGTLQGTIDAMPMRRAGKR